MSATASSPAESLDYSPTTLCPVSSRLLPGEVFGCVGAVKVSRWRPEHGEIEALDCSGVNWFEGLRRFDVPLIKDARLA